jgi:flavin-dependent dehydrogenase
MMMDHNVDVAIIGAGPAGCSMAALLLNAGLTVAIIERSRFPRFVIGESLLPQLMRLLDEADLLSVVQNECFQFKNGAVFNYRGQESSFCFEDQFTQDWGTTFQVERDRFDKCLADEVERRGAQIFYQETVNGYDRGKSGSSVSTINANGDCSQFHCKFVCDASGFGKVLARCMNLQIPSGFPDRQSIFSHLEMEITDSSFDQNKILIAVHPENQDVWYWLIPLSKSKYSIGVVASTAYFESLNMDNTGCLQSMIDQQLRLKKLLGNCKFSFPPVSITAYSSAVSTLHGDGFVLLGNAGDFLDPVFSSGVTIALKSSSLAAPLVIRELKGDNVDWHQEFTEPLMQGVNTFKDYVEAWYDCRFQDVIFHEEPDVEVRKMICSILAGYAWDLSNPYVSKSKRRLNALAQICKK